MNYTALFRLVFPWFLLFIYKYLFCLYSDEMNLVCEMNWKNGLFLTIPLTVINLYLVSRYKARYTINDIIIKWVLALVLYTVLFGLIAFPYMVASFFQRFENHSLLHIAMLNILFDVLITMLSLKAPETNSN